MLQKSLILRLGPKKERFAGAKAKPEMVYPETSAPKSTRPSGSGGLVQSRSGHSNFGFTLKPADFPGLAARLKPCPVTRPFPWSFSAASKAVVLQNQTYTTGCSGAAVGRLPMPCCADQGRTPGGTRRVTASGTMSMVTGRWPRSSPSASAKTRAEEPFKG